MVEIAPTIKAFDDLLGSMIDVDYVGTRLHAGIRALQMKRRAIILAIDNRATEMAKDFGLPVLPREKTELLEEMIESSLPLEIDIPVVNINKWLDQFRR